MTRHISYKDTARLIRNVLKEHFPTIKFSVRSDTYTGGASIDVTWTDGPTASAVEAKIKRFEGADFDPMIDLKSSVDSTLDGERVHFDADWVFTHRRYSADFLRRVATAFCTRYGLPTPAVVESEFGAWVQPGNEILPQLNRTIDQAIGHEAQQITA